MAPKDLVDCGFCKEKLPKNGDFAICSHCCNGLHCDRDCSGLKKTSWKSMGSTSQGGWVCPHCRKQRKESASNSQGADEDVFYAEDVQQEILTKVNSLMEIKEQVQSIDNAMKFFSEKYDTLLQEMAELRAENQGLKKQIQSLKTSETTVIARTNQLTTELAELDQYGRRVNLEIQGLPVDGELKNEDMDKVLEEVAKDIGVNYSPSEVHQAHRLQPRKNGKPPTIIVQFHSKTVRDSWLQKGKRAKLTKKNSKVFFNENLCPKYRMLLQEAKIRANTSHYSFVWFSGGRILAKKDEQSNNVIVIRDMDDLNKIK